MTVDAGDRPIRLRVDPTQLEQVIMNLVVNARDAMPSGGHLSIGVSEARIDKSYCEHNPDCHPGSYVCIAITDTGCGINPETISRLFEPFFTTKEIGKGTGLGLATVYGHSQAERWPHHGLQRGGSWHDIQGLLALDLRACFQPRSRIPRWNCSRWIGNHLARRG